MSQYKHTESEARVRAALATMPYGAIERVNSQSRRVGMNADRRPCVIELDDVANYLVALSDVLREFSEQHKLEREELSELRAQRAAVRRFLGLESG